MRILLLLALAACSTQQKKAIPPTVVTLPPVEVTPPASTGVESGASSDSPSTQPVHEEKTKTQIKLNITPKGFKNSESRIRRILSRVELIANSEEFKGLVVNYYNPILKQNKFYSISRPLSMTNGQVWETVTAKDFTADYIAYCSGGSTVGYTYPSVSWVRVNTCHSNYKSDKLVAKNICHEFLGHKHGFGHSQKWNRLRDTSTPYKLGDFCAQLWDVKLREQ